jgi:hypothetical protein
MHYIARSALVQSPSMFRSLWVRDLVRFVTVVSIAAIAVIVALVKTSPRAAETPTPRSEDVRASLMSSVESNYHAYDINGFRVHFNRTWFDPNSPRCQAIVRALERMMANVTMVVPQATLDRLAEVSAIWVEWDIGDWPELRAKLGTCCAFYHGRGQWYEQRPSQIHRLGSITVFAGELFDEQVAEEQLAWNPFLLVHELAHAQHDLTLGRDSPEVVKLYSAAMDAGLYEKVELVIRRPSGPSVIKHERAYGAENPREYFAELSKAYLAWSQYFPHNRGQLAKHDPRGYALMKKVWGDTPEVRQRVTDRLVRSLPLPFAR